jgi:1,2-diacylglycerol 3-beta-galactosyltransferase
MGPVSGSKTAEILVLIVDAGGGHRSAANALVATGAAEGVPFSFRVESLQDVLGSVDVLRRFSGRSIEEVYNDLLQKHHTRLWGLLLWILHTAIRIARPALLSRLERRLRARAPDLVLSLAPNFNGVIRDAVKRALPGVPFLILLTDYADVPPHFWVEKGVDGVIVGSEQAVSQAAGQGVPPERIHRVSGMVLHPRFYAPRPPASSFRTEFGIPEGAFTVLVLFGGVGASEIEPLCEALLQGEADWHVVAVAGRNPELEERLRAAAPRFGGRLHPVGFTDRMPEFMAGADLLLTKPGPGTIAEALHVGLPLIVVSGAYTVPQERFNARFLEDEGLGIVVPHWKSFPGAAAGFLREGGQKLTAAREAVRRLAPNRASYEVLEILRVRLQEGSSGV